MHPHADNGMRAQLTENQVDYAETEVFFSLFLLENLWAFRTHFKNVTRVGSPLLLYRYAWGVQPERREEDWGRGLLGSVAIRCVRSD